MYSIKRFAKLNVSLGSGVLFIAALTWVIVWAFFWWQYTVDDSYITYQYSRNIAAGNGSVFNAGERVEGFSCPFWVALLASSQALYIDIISFSKAVGLLSAVILPIGMFFLASLYCKNRLIPGLAAILIATVPEVNIYACSGMETVPFAASVAIAVIFLSSHIRTLIKSILVVTCLLIVLTFRPEGLLLAPIFLCIALWRTTFRWGKFVLLCFIPVAGFLLLMRWDYYGSLLPNTYLAKPSPVVFSILHNPFLVSVKLILKNIITQDLRTLFISSGGILIFPLGLFGLFWGIAMKRHLLVVHACVAALIVGAIYTSYSPADWMPGNRFMLPFIFPGVLLTILGFDEGVNYRPGVAVKLSSSLFKNHPPIQNGSGGTPCPAEIGAKPQAKPCLFQQAVRAIFVPLIVLVIIFNCYKTSRWAYSYSVGVTINKALNASAYVEIGKWLKAHAFFGDKVLAYEVGALGYYSGLNVIDHEGLIDKQVAQYIKQAGGYGRIRNGSDEKNMLKVVNYCIDRKPDWFLLRSSVKGDYAVGQQLPSGVANEEIQNTLLDKFGSAMVVAKVFMLDKRGLDKYVLLRRNIN